MTSRWSQSVVVTGCGAGIGEATLLHLSQEHYYVVGVERDPRLAQAIQKTLGDHGTVVSGDVRDTEVLAESAAMARAVAPLQGWVNNAGIEGRAALHEIESGALNELLAIDLLAFIWGSQIAVRSFMEQRSGGSIVNVSSLHGRLGYSGWVAYDVAKGGVDSLTRYTAVEYGPVGIRANAVAPGSVRTQMHERYLRSTTDAVRAEHDMAAAVPLRRIALPNEIAAVISFLVSESSSYVTGQSIPVDGGLSVAGGVFDPHPDLIDKYGPRPSRREDREQ